MPNGIDRTRTPRTALVSFLVTAIAATVVTVSPVAVLAAEPNQVMNLNAVQQEGFTTLSWDPVTAVGVTGYEITRTAVDAANVPTGPVTVVGVWRANRQINQSEPTIADAGYQPGLRFGWRVRALRLSSIVTINAPSLAAGTYGAQAATFGPALTEIGLSASFSTVSGPGANPGQGCGALTGFPAGSIAVVDRGSGNGGTCSYSLQATSAQAAGASAVVVVNNTAGDPVAPGGSGAGVTIPVVMVSQANGGTIKAGLPASGTVQSAGVAPPFSEPVFDTTLPPVGPTEFLTQFETTQGAQFTSYDSEIAWTRAIDAASDRVRVVTLGYTAQGREINLFILGYPAPLGTVAEIEASPTSGANCNVHGNEPTGREGCFMMIRKLAFSNEPWVIDLLSNATVLFVPSFNGDGRAANTRGNSTGQDLNRDHGRLTQPETQVFARFIRDYTPEVMVDGHEFGDNATCDLPLLWPRHSNTAAAVHNESKRMVESPMYQAASVDGWWPCPYPLPGIDGAQSFTRVTGLKNMIVTLVEARSAGGATRPNEGNTQNNRRRKAYSHQWLIRIALAYHRANLAAVQTAIQQGIAFQTSNTGRVVFHGDWDVQDFPAPHPGDNPPPNNPPGPDQILDPPPCGYKVSEALYTTPLDDSGSLPVAQWTTAQQRLASHGIAVQDRPAGHIVRMAQPLRGLINIVLDAETPPAPIVGAERLYACPYVTTGASAFNVGTIEGTSTTASLAINNIAVEPNQPLTWTITEAASSCASPSDLGWVSASATSGSVASGGSASTNVTLTFNAAGLSAPDVFTGVLCLATNDPGDPLITIPVRLQVQYPFGGFQPPIGSGLNVVQAGAVVPVKFQVGGERDSLVLAAGYPKSVQINCTTGVPMGAMTATNSGSGLVWDGEKYQYDWKTAKNWAGTCRQLIVVLDDATVHTASFSFVK